MTTFREAIAGAQYRADQSVNGVGPHAGDRTTDAEWRALINDAVKYAWRVASAARPDFQVAQTGTGQPFPDYTVTAGGSASIAVPANFYDMLDLVYGPDTTSEYSLGPFTWQNRRAPGAWLPPFVTGGIGGSSCRLMGSNIFIEPSVRAGGIYRLWYCPAAKLIRADATVALATTSLLPPYNVSGPAGFGHTLTATANGALTLDGSTVAAATQVLVKNETLDPTQNGVYNVANPGNAGAPFVLSRPASPAPTTNGFGTMVQVTGGATNIDVFFETTSLTTVVDSTAWTWTEAFLDPILADHAPELIKIKTAIPAIDRDDDLSLVQLNKDLLTQSAQFAAYLRQVRTANGPQKIIDTDAMGPRGWGFGW